MCIGSFFHYCVGEALPSTLYLFIRLAFYDSFRNMIVASMNNV